MNVVIVLLILSGIIAVVGNRIGRYFGKRRLTLFNLRPRDTASVFTVLSGILIMAVTFATLVITSRDVRIALFGMEKLKASIIESKAQLEKSKTELQDLNKELTTIKIEKANIERIRENLKKEVERQRSRTVVFKAGQNVLITKFSAGEGTEKTEEGLKTILAGIDRDVKKNGIQDVEVDKTDFDSAVSYLANISGEAIVKVVSIKNVVVGANLPVSFDVSLNELVYKKGEEIVRADISGKLSQSDVEQRIRDLASKADAEAQKRGVMTVGAAISSEIYNTARRIRGYGLLAKVKVVALKDIYSIGPLAVRFEVEI